MKRKDPPLKETQTSTFFFFQRKKLIYPSRKPPSQHHLPLSEIETIPCAESKILFSEDAAKPLNKKTEKVKFVTTSKSGCCESQHKEKRRNQSRRSEEDQPLEKKNESPSFLATRKKKRVKVKQMSTNRPRLTRKRISYKTTSPHTPRHSPKQTSYTNGMVILLAKLSIHHISPGLRPPRIVDLIIRIQKGCCQVITPHLVERDSNLFILNI